MEKKNKNSIFSLVVSILSLAFITIGTTFSFFSTVVKSDEDIKVEAANFKMSVNVTPLYNKKTIIPTNDKDIENAFYNECIDDNEYGACYAYDIAIIGEGNTQDIIANFKTEQQEGLKNLKYMVLDKDTKDENNKYKIYGTPTLAPTQEYEKIGDSPIRLESGKTKNLILIIWLSNQEDKPQDDETDKWFKGYFVVNSTLGPKITGSITASVNN